MKVVHIVGGSINGGASKGAYWLHRGLKSIGVQSKILTNSLDRIDDDDIIYLSDGSFFSKFRIKVKAFLDTLIPRMYRISKYSSFSTGFFGHNIVNHEEFLTADIVHLHWINSGMLNLNSLTHSKKIIVWTIRDMWPFTGGCHYAVGCEKYKTGCGSCAILNSKNNVDLSRFVLNRKRKNYSSDMQIIGISNWLSGLANESLLFKNMSVTTIYNGVNLSEFKRYEKDIARSKIGLITEKKIILSGAQNINNDYKGFDKFVEALQHLDSRKYFLCFFGSLNKEIFNEIDFEYLSFGYVNSNEKLSLLYSAADVFVAPSLMDAFGKTIVESMSCGTPVVCFDMSGPGEIVQHKKDGYRAIPNNAKDLADGIKWIVEESQYEIVRNNASENCKRYDNVSIAKQYFDLYDKLISKK